MYLDYWLLTKPPFENVNDPSFMYASSKHREALARIRYAVEQKKLGAMLLGHYGTGKTYSSRVLRRLCEGPHRTFIFFTNPRISPEEFLKEIFLQLGDDANVQLPSSKGELSRLVQNRLKDVHAQGRHVVVVVDEVQSIEDQGLLEEIRLLLNMQGDDENFFTLLLLGQPQFKEMLDKIPQFKQRLAIVYTLEQLDAQESSAYVIHRLAVAGSKKEIFDAEALAEVHRVSQGMPRVINNVSDLSLLHAFLKKMSSVTAQAVREASAEIANTACDAGVA
jgi:type II secretory pathway predicted ATPase ExeA